MTITSNWRIRSRQVIQRVLAALPADATEKQKRQAISDAYPFGTREHHPYKCWLIEVKAALGTRHPEADTKPSIRATFWHERSQWFLGVSCGWCNNKIKGGCLVCLPLHKRLEQLVTCDLWQRWYTAIRDDFDSRGAWSDWLEENGYPDVAELVRATVKVKCPTCKGKGEYQVTRTSGIGDDVRVTVRCRPCNKTGEVLRVEVAS